MYSVRCLSIIRKAHPSDNGGIRNIDRKTLQGDADMTDGIHTNTDGMICRAKDG